MLLHAKTNQKKNQQQGKKKSKRFLLMPFLYIYRQIAAGIEAISTPKSLPAPPLFYYKLPVAQMYL